MQVAVKHYTRDVRDFHEVTVARDAYPSAHQAELIRAKVAEFLAGKLKPIAKVERGTNDAIERKARIRKLVLDPKTKQPVSPRKYRYEEVRLAAEHVFSATLFPCHESGESRDPVTGTPFLAYVAVVAHDGSAVHLPVKPDELAELAEPDADTEDDDGKGGK